MKRIRKTEIKDILTELGRSPITACTLESPNCVSLSRSKLQSRIVRSILDEFYYGRFAFTVALIIQASAITNNQYLRVLDVGCANGDLLIILSRFLSTRNLTGLDAQYDPSFPQEFEIVNTTVPPLPIATCSLDVITCIGTTEHIFDEETFINEVYRILKPEGTYICTMPVEIGSAGLIRHIVKNLVYPDRTDCKSIFDYSFAELIGRCPRQQHGIQHKYYNHKYLLTQLRSQFREVVIYSWPRYWSRFIAPVLFAKCIK